MALSDVVKKGSGIPSASSLIVGGIGVDSANGKMYIKKDDLSVVSPGGTATETVNTPAGGIVATDVQAAINELDAGKEPADATILKDADIGVTVLAPDGDGSGLIGVDAGFVPLFDKKLFGGM